MKSIIIICFLILFCGANIVIAQVYIPTDNGSSIMFIIKNLGFNVDGSFKNLQGNINFDPGNLKSSVFKVTVDAATVNTGNKSRDSHLKKEEYFNVTEYPTISFLSDKIEKDAGPGMYMVNGKFTVKGKSKIISIPFTAAPQNDGYLFTGKITLNRRDFDVGGNSLVLSDNLTLKINVFAQKGKN